MCSPTLIKLQVGRLMCFRAAAYKELDLLKNLQREVFYSQLRVLE